MHLLQGLFVTDNIMFDSSVELLTSQNKNHPPTGSSANHIGIVLTAHSDWPLPFLESQTDKAKANSKYKYAWNKHLWPGISS